MSAPATEADGPGAVTRQAGRLLQLSRRVLPSRMGPSPAPRYELALVATGYLLAAVVVTALLWRDPASRIVNGNPGDPDQSAWWLRYAADAVAHWHLPALITTGMNAPVGVNAMWNPSLLAPGVVLSLVTLAAGPQVSLTVMLTVGFAGSATSLYWVLRQWSAGTVAAVAGGLAYGFSPALAQSALGHYDLQFAVLPPLIVHFAARLVTGRGEPARCGAALGLLTALQLLTCEELLFNTVVAIAVGIAAAAISRPGSARGTTEYWLGLAAGAMAAAGAFLLLAGYPVWTQFAGPLAQHGSPYLLDYYKNDLKGFIEPSRLQLIHSAGSAAFADRFQGNLSEYLGYLGWPMLFVLAWTAITLWQMLAVRVLAVTFLVLEVFSLGGTLLNGGHVHDWLKLPWYWLQGLPVATSAIVDRFSIIADGCAAALLAIAIDAVWRSLPQSRSRPWRRLLARAAVGLAVAVVVAPVLPAPLPTTRVAGVPAGWGQANADLRLPASASELTIPVPADSFTTPLRWQADTGWPASMVGGYFIGPVAGGQAFVDTYGLSSTALFLNRLWQVSGTEGVSTAGLQTTDKTPPDGLARAWIQSTGVAGLVAVTSPDSALAQYLDVLLGPPSVQSGDVLGWRVHL